MIEIFDSVGPSLAQFKIVLRGMRNPLNSWDKGDTRIDEPSFDNPIGHLVIGSNDMDLCKRLISAGPEHRKFLRQLDVIADINGPLYWWKQLDTYQHTVKNSCSSMHKLTHKWFEPSDFSLDHVDDPTVREIVYMDDNAMVSLLNALREAYLKAKNGELGEDVDAEAIWNAINEFLPQSYNQLRTWKANYETLLNICIQRSNHKLNEWHVFIQWILDEVPFFKELCYDYICERVPGFEKEYK